MKVRAIKSFSGPGFSYAEGQVFDLPKGVDWLRCGFCEKVEKEAKQAAKKK